MEWQLTVIAFFTSLIAGVVGIAGGMVLVGVMPWYLPVPAIVPIHSAVQFFSNISRGLFAFSSIQWCYVKEYVFGALLGVCLFGAIYLWIPIDPLQWITPAIGIYILLTLWWKGLSQLFEKVESFYLVAAIQTGLGLFVGPTGPLATCILVKSLTQKNQLVATLATFMTIGHVFKIAFFVFIGFAFHEYLGLLIMMSLAAISGSYVGTVIRGCVDASRFYLAVKLLLSGIAVLMVFKALVNF